jgi:TolB-like protein/DNA-binding winged helix-turn-helix (wHTH) protein/lipoprotein NlpI
MLPALFKFADFELDCSRYELRRKGYPLKLEKIPMELLLFLAESDGRLVSREEIEERLWGKEVFVDAEHGINTAIRKIRQVLGDDPDNPRFVQTVQRKGYRFIAEFSQVPSVPGEHNGLGTVPEPANQSVPLPRQDLPVQNLPSASASASVTEKLTQQKSPTRRTIIWMVAAAAALLSIWPAYKFTLSRLTRSVSAQPAIRSIAVLPLENLSGGAADEYFADGMTDELITTLAKYKSLRVISRTSIMQYKKIHRPLPEIARELEVDGIVEGSVSRSQDRVRVTAQLVYAPTDTHLWAESYDRDLSDVLSMQQDLARSIAERVTLASSPHSTSPKLVRTAVNPAARDAYLRGRYYWFSDRYEKSREFFQEAIRLDPNYALAFSGLADSYAAAAVSGESRPLDTMPLAETAARKALELDDSLPEAHNPIAAILFFYRWDWDAAEKESQRAIELNPSFAEAHHLHAYVLGTLNRTDESLQEDKLTLELDPFARPWVYGYGLLRARRFDEALKEFTQRSEARPDSAMLHAFLCIAYAYKGDYKHAIDEWKKELVIEGHSESAARIERSYQKAGFKGVNQDYLNELKRAAANEYVSPVHIACVAARSGRNEETIHYLELAFQQRDPQLVYLQHNPALDPLRPDPAFSAIATKMHLPR